MTANLQVVLIRSQLLHLLPFLNTIFVYFVFVEEPRGELWTTLLKCGPIVSLTLYILLKGFSLTNEHKRSQRILVGLIFSCIGDALLNVGLFPQGMGAFAVAHIFYISSFNWRPLKLIVGLPLYVSSAAMVILLYERLDAVLAVGLPIYSALLTTMCWRAVVRAITEKDLLNVFCAIGSIIFLISDALIGIDMFLLKLPYARIWIMTTYYTAQCSLALSTATESKQMKLLIGSANVKSDVLANGFIDSRRRVKINRD